MADNAVANVPVEIDNEIEKPKDFPFSGKLIYNDGLHQIVEYKPNYEQTANELARIFVDDLSIFKDSAVWCTLSRGYAERYFCGFNSLILITENSRPAYLVCDKTKEFKDNKNRSLKADGIETITNVIKFLIQTNRIHPINYHDFAVIFYSMISEEDALSDPALFVDYCIAKKRKRWKEHEKRLLSRNGGLAFLYASKVAQGRVPSLEGTIAKNGRAFLNYIYYLQNQRIQYPEDIVNLHELLSRKWHWIWELGTDEYNNRIKQLRKAISDRAKNEKD